jgi:hypothetical protein
MAVLVLSDFSMQLVVKALPTEEKTWDQIVPPQYHKWHKVFSEKELNRLPKHQPWDLTIDFIEGMCNVPTGRLSDLDTRGCFNGSTTTRCVTLL